MARPATLLVYGTALSDCSSSVPECSRLHMLVTNVRVGVTEEARTLYKRGLTAPPLGFPTLSQSEHVRGFCFAEGQMRTRFSFRHPGRNRFGSPWSPFTTKDHNCSWGCCRYQSCIQYGRKKHFSWTRTLRNAGEKVLGVVSDRPQTLCPSTKG